jgi:hypothetical protein
VAYVLSEIPHPSTTEWSGELSFLVAVARFPMRPQTDFKGINQNPD